MVIASLNTLTILYNSCSVVVSVLVWTVIRKHLVAGQKWAFWLLLFVIGFIEVMAFIASAEVGNARWQVNVVSERSIRGGHGSVGLCPVQRRQEMNPVNKTARRAGLLYLIYMVFHISADVIGRSRLIVFGDAATTAGKYRGVCIAISYRHYGRSGRGCAVPSDSLGFVRAAGSRSTRTSPLLFLLLNLTGVAIQCSSDLFLFASQLLLSGADYLKVFQADQLPALAMLSLYLYKNGFMIAQLFYGAWLFPLGYLGFSNLASFPGFWALC